ncbi:MAG TPA: YceI family protein [Rhizomicrobium sp.]|nr:YceI family protein [Rhizomicrobium sp.]
MARRNPHNRLAAGLILVGLALVGWPAAPAGAQAAAPASYILNKNQSRFLFSIGHFFVSSTEGKFTVFDGRLMFPPQAPENGTVTIHVSPGSISTGIAARDDHLRSADFFDADKFPLATFASTGLVRNSGSIGKLAGMLTLHGVTKPITLDVTLKTPDLNADRLEFSASAKMKRSDFGMTGYMGVIGDEVSLTIDAEFDRDH